MTVKLSQKWLRARRTYLDLWEDAQRLHDVALPEVKIALRPWGKAPKIKWGTGYVSGDVRAECGEPNRTKGGSCQRAAGSHTWHVGVGRCSFHGGNTESGTTEGIMIMACAYASFYSITPAEALQGELERTEGAVRWLDEKLGEAVDDGDVLPEGKLGQYTELRIRERAHLVRVAVASITAGVTEIIGERMRVDGERVASLLSTTLDRLELDEETGMRARELLADQMRALAVIEAGANGAARAIDSQ